MTFQICITLILVGSAFVSASVENITDDDITKVVNNIICDYEDLCLSDALDVDPPRRQKTSVKNIIRQPDKICCQPCLCTKKLCPRILLSLSYSVSNFTRDVPRSK